MRSFNNDNAISWANFLFLSAILGLLIGNVFSIEIYPEVSKPQGVRNLLIALFYVPFIFVSTVLLLEGWGWKKMYTIPLTKTIPVNQMRAYLVAGTFSFGLIGYFSYAASFAVSAFCVLSIASSFYKYAQNEDLSLAMVIANGFDHPVLKSELFKAAAGLSVLSLSVTSYIKGSLEVFSLIPLTVIALAAVFVIVREVVSCLVDVAKEASVTHIVYGAVIICLIIIK